MSVLSTKGLSAQIRSIKGNSKKLRDQIQEVLVSCAYQGFCANANYFNDMLDAVGNGARREALIAWSKEHGYVTYDAKTKKFAINSSKRKEDGCDKGASFDDKEIEIRAATPWYDMRIETVDGDEGDKPKFDVYAYLEKALTKLDNEGETELADMLQDAVNGFTKARALKGLATAELKRISQATLVESLGEALV